MEVNRKQRSMTELKPQRESENEKRREREREREKPEECQSTSNLPALPLNLITV